MSCLPACLQVVFCVAALCLSLLIHSRDFFLSRSHSLSLAFQFVLLGNLAERATDTCPCERACMCFSQSRYVSFKSAKKQHTHIHKTTQQMQGRGKDRLTLWTKQICTKRNITTYKQQNYYSYELLVFFCQPLAFYINLFIIRQRVSERASKRMSAKKNATETEQSRTTKAKCWLDR